MIRLAGIDYSTRAIDVVLLPYDAEQADDAIWRRIDITGNKATDDAWHAALRVRDRMAGAVDWSNVALVYLEKPYSQNKNTIAALGLIAGAILASLPVEVRRGAVNQVPAWEWRRLFGIKGGGTSEQIKERVRWRAIGMGFRPGPKAPLDAFEAFGIAWAARNENQRAIRAGGGL